tara:strand:+ start:107 stop:745 length:639 start_codon:yes stop_codon:yes gene_type:complete
MIKKISVIDYGAGNILSVSRAFKECNSSIEIISDSNKIKNSGFLVLPGDGSFSYASKQLKKKKIFQILKDHAKKGNPLMGICLGMQMLLTESEEFGKHDGLDIIKGKIKKIKIQNNKSFKIPVIGWHSLNNIQIDYSRNFKSFNKFLDKRFYFVHSFKALPENKKEVLASYKYGKEKITAIIGKDNVIGTQFHPEKSGVNGINLIKNLIKVI